MCLHLYIIQATSCNEHERETIIVLQILACTSWSSKQMLWTHCIIVYFINFYTAFKNISGWQKRSLSHQVFYLPSTTPLCKSILIYIFHHMKKPVKFWTFEKIRFECKNCCWWQKPLALSMYLGTLFNIYTLTQNSKKGRLAIIWTPQHS